MTDTGKAGESRGGVDPERLKRLTELTRGFTDASSFSEIMRHAAEHTAGLLDAEKAILMLADEEGLLRVQGSFGVSEDVVSRFRGLFDESVASRLQGLFGTAEGFLGVPLVSQGRVIGLLAVMAGRCRRGLRSSYRSSWFCSGAPVNRRHLSSRSCSGSCSLRLSSQPSPRRQ